MPAPPQVPRPLSKRGRWLARQRIDQSQGLFGERVQEFTFGPIAPNGGVGQTTPTPGITIPSMGGRYIRCLAMRGTIKAPRLTFAEKDFALASLQLRAQLNAQGDMITGLDPPNATSFRMLFGDAQQPWLWFLSPPVFRAGDLLTMTVTNTDLALTITPDIGLRLIDDELWQELFSRGVFTAQGPS